MTHVIYRLGLLSTLFRFLFSHPHPHNRWIYAQGNLGNPVLMKTDFLLTSQRLCPCCQALQDSKREISPRLHYDSIVHPRCTRFLYWGVCVHTWHNSLVEVRGQLQESVLSLYRVDPRNWLSDCLTWQQAFLLADPPCQPGHGLPRRTIGVALLHLSQPRPLLWSGRAPGSAPSTKHG